MGRVYPKSSASCELCGPQSNQFLLRNPGPHPKYRSSDDIHSQLSENRAKENQGEQEDGASYDAAVQAKQMEEAGECTGFHKQVKNGVKIKEKIPTLEEDIEVGSIEECLQSSGGFPQHSPE